MPLVVSWQGKGELQSLSQVEASAYQRALSGKNLRCGFYLNELLMRLLPKHDPHARLFAIYTQTLESLQNAACEKALRLFEKNLLMEIGLRAALWEEQKFRMRRTIILMSNTFFALLYWGVKIRYNRSFGVFSGKTLNALLTENFEDSFLSARGQEADAVCSGDSFGTPLGESSLFEYQLEMEE